MIGLINSAMTMPFTPPARYSPAALAKGVTCGINRSVTAPTTRPAPSAWVVSPIVPDFRNEPNLPLAEPTLPMPLRIPRLTLRVLRLAIGFDCLLLVFMGFLLLFLLNRLTLAILRRIEALDTIIST